MLLALTLGTLCPLASQRVVQDSAVRVAWLMRNAQQTYDSLRSMVRGLIVLEAVAGWSPTCASNQAAGWSPLLIFAYHDYWEL